MSSQPLTLNNASEALNFLRSLNEQQEPTKKIHLAESLVELKILIEGDAYSGKLTGEIAKALGLYQDAIYNFAKTFIFNNPNARLTVLQKKELEILIDVRDGSLSLKVLFEKLFDAINDPLSKMSPKAAVTLLIVLALIATLGVTGYAFGGKALDNADRADQRDHVHDTLKLALDAQNQTLEAALGFLEENLKKESQQHHEFAMNSIELLAKAQTQGLMEVAKAAPDADSVSFGESKLDKDALEALSRRSPRSTAEQINREGLYSVLAETLPNGITKVTFHGPDLPGEITADFIESEFTTQQADLLWEAIRNRTKVNVKLQATLIRDSVRGGVLIDILQ